MANLRMENFGLTIADADKALELDPKYIKAYYRKGSAHMVLQKYQEAMADFKKVSSLLTDLTIDTGCSSKRQRSQDQVSRMQKR
jgi:tetratricopeptide (TPR) repeat protein